MPVTDRRRSSRSTPVCIVSGTHTGDQEMVEAFAPQGADPALRDRVRPRRSHWRADGADVGAGEHGVKGGGELAVTIADQESELGSSVAEVHDQVVGLLGDPRPGGWAVIP